MSLSWISLPRKTASASDPNPEPFIFTEMIRCGEIGTHAIESFHEHHPDLVVNIFLGPEDLQFIPDHPNNRCHLIRKDTPIYDAFNMGHLGTSMLQERIFTSNPGKKLIHFDADVYFTGNIIDDIIEGLKTHDLVGSFRPYRLNPNKRDDLRKYADAIQTYCFGVNTAKITVKDPDILAKYIQGHGWRHPTLDYFDPVTFHILDNGGTIKYLPVEVIGGVDQEGNRKNGYLINEEFDYGDKIIHFAGVGSGRNFHTMRLNNQTPHVPEFYVQFGIERYDMYLRIFSGKSILPDTKYDIAGIRQHMGLDTAVSDK